MDLDDYAGVGAEAAPIVADVRSVGRADFDEAGAAFCHDVGNAKASPDLDQFASRHDGLTSLSDRVEGEHQRRRSIVDDERVFGAGELAKQRRAMDVARSPSAGVEIKLDIRES